jgi:hypothetical protein
MEVVKETTNSYDPNKRYSWTPQDQFVMSGSEFGLMLNTFRAILNTPEASKILMADQANRVIESVLAKAVESGQVKEAPEEEGQQ